MSCKVLLAGIAGASLGTEIIKSLYRAGGYEIYGCDISTIAYGLYSDKLKDSFVAERSNYVESIISICKNNGIKYIIPGGEQPTVLLSQNAKSLEDNGLILVSNSKDIITLFSNKRETFKFLNHLGFDTPKTYSVNSQNDLKDIEFPCIVKPSTGTGGSDSVFLATSLEECNLYVELLTRNSKDVIIQEYIDDSEGEYTIGVLSNTDSKVIGSVCMKRAFDSKLSVSYRGTKGLISSGYSQGLISDFPELRSQAEEIAIASNSIGPLNIQARVKSGRLIPFEINPRFSASTYLRALAGFNEIHFYMQHLLKGEQQLSWKLKEGYYMRSFEEKYIPLTDVKRT